MADDDAVCIEDVVVPDKQHEQLEHIGLSLDEAKTLLLGLQRQVVTRQIAAFLTTRAACTSCGRPRGINDHKTIVFRTLFGNLELASPRLRRCPCQHDGQLSTSPLVELLPEHTAPELVYLESKWSSLVSYGLTVKALCDFLPIDAKLSATSVRRNTLRVAARCERDLTHDEAATQPLRSGQDVPGVVGIDGGYLRHWEHKHTHFVAIV
ncbi:MAG: ISKra4 family transposase, partial [Chloroflexi bacterium]|nr:ISKra4 family transposase [Chloroflexota bacterium]